MWEGTASDLRWAMALRADVDGVRVAELVATLL
jgi:hypothetical protein